MIVGGAKVGYSLYPSGIPRGWWLLPYPSSLARRVSFFEVSRAAQVPRSECDVTLTQTYTDGGLLRCYSVGGCPFTAPSRSRRAASQDMPRTRNSGPAAFRSFQQVRQGLPTPEPPCRPWAWSS